MQESAQHPDIYLSETNTYPPQAQRYPYALTIILGISCALLMFQLYLVAALVPVHSREFHSSLMGMAIPGFAIPFSLTAAGMALFPQAIRRPDKWLLFSLLAMSAGSLWLGIADSGEVFLLNRIMTGLGTGMMLPAALIIATRSVDKREAFTNLAVIIFFLATGMTFAPSTGGWLNGSLGWRFLFQAVGVAAALLCLCFLLIKKDHRELLYRQQHIVKAPSGLRAVWEGRAIYAFVYLSGVFHSGVFVWIIVYFSTQYGLDEFQIANPLIIFGLPGLTVTFLMFRYHLDSKVTRLLYTGLALTICGLLIMMANLPLWLAECLLAVMSLGYCFSQPLFIGILKLPPSGVRAGRLIALGSGILFAGYGTGPLVMSALLGAGKTLPSAFLVTLVAVMAALSRRIWRLPQWHSHRQHLLSKAGGPQVQDMTGTSDERKNFTQ